MALRFGTRKKLDAVLDLKQLFTTMATMPPTGIAEDSDWIDLEDIANFDSLYAEVCIFHKGNINFLLTAIY